MVTVRIVWDIIQLNKSKYLTMTDYMCFTSCETEVTCLILRYDLKGFKEMISGSL